VWLRRGINRLFLVASSTVLLRRNITLVSNVYQGHRLGPFLGRLTRLDFEGDFAMMQPWLSLSSGLPRGPPLDRPLF
jgi:hypothetical protein